MILAKHCGKDVSQVKIDTERDNIMDPEAALEYGLIDEIVRSVADPEETPEDSAE
jgi:ATP-dependent Clp protease protease subunit